MARIGNETSLVLKLAAARVELERRDHLSRVAQMCSSNLTSAEALIKGFNEAIDFYRQILLGVVSEQEQR